MYTSILDLLTNDHRTCDEAFTRAEQAIDEENWPQAETLTNQFLAHMDSHFSLEEDILFPAMDAKTGAGCGPTSVMRMEHQQMNQLKIQMRAAAANKNKDAFLGASETLMMLMQQHNIKEEQILYPMADNLCAAECASIIDQMNTLQAARLK